MSALQAYLWLMATVWGLNLVKVARERPLPVLYILGFAFMTAWSLVLNW